MKSHDSISPQVLVEMELRDVKYEADPKSGCTLGELDRRLRAMLKNPSRAVPWNEAKQRIMKRTGKHK
jgi:hypothetical protein